MTDEEIIRACAEKVFGWKPISWEEVQRTTNPGVGMFYVLESRVWYFGPPSSEVYTEWCDNFPWNPLDEDVHACEILDHMQAQGWAYDIGTWRHGFNQTVCRFILGSTDRGLGEATVKGIDGASRRRAIVLAALRAIGVECNLSA